MFRRPWNRGTSVLAALVFVALLTGVAIAVSAASPQSHTASIENKSQLAETGTAAERGITQSNVSADCDTAKKSAAASKTPDSLSVAKGKEIKDSCIAAIYSPKGQNSRRDDPNNYKCVGKSATVSIAHDGTVSVKSAPNQSVLPGVCSTLACTPTGNGNSKCTQVNMAGIDKTKLNNYFGGRVPDAEFFTMADDKVEKAMALDPRASSGIDQAFAAQQEAMQQQYTQSDETIKKLDAMIQDCSASETPCANVNDLQKQRDELAAKQIELKGQMNTLSQARADLTPESGVEPGTDQPGVAKDCAQTGTCVGPDGKQIPKTQPCTFGSCNSNAGPGTAPPDNSQKDAGGGLEKMLQSVLSGIGSGLSKALAGSSAAACSSDPNLYAQQQQQYNAQLQQYNLQLQQYNYQSQYAQLNGLTPPPPPTAPQSCQQTSSSNTCPAAPAQPTTSCNGTWKPVTTQQSNGSQCTTSWQCIPTSATQPTAQISCQPLVADVGMSVAIAYSCGNATGSEALGFDSGNATSGSTSTVIAAPPSGTNTATYGIACKNNGVVAKAECSVQVGRPSIVLVATPKIIPSGDKSNIGWITSGMKSCIISSPTLADFTAQNATNTSVSGAVTTPALTSDTVFELQCSTVGSSTKSASTTVLIATSTNQ